jgi:hypothetical protein
MGTCHPYQSSIHGTQTPHIERIVVVLHVNQQLRTFEIARSDANIVVLVGVIEFGETPINQAQLSSFVVNHDIVRLDISVHDATLLSEWW